jgi:NADH-quinone oxidoreductase subunit F
MMANPHTLVEGVIIASYAIRAKHAFIYSAARSCTSSGACSRPCARPTRGRLPRQEHPRHRLRPGHRRPRRRRRLHLRRGDGAARLARGPPRPAAPAPPFPAVAGLYASPTVINNVESIASCPTSSTTGSTGSSPWAPRSPRLQGLLAVGPRQPPGPSTRRRWASPCASCSSSPAASATGHELKFWHPGRLVRADAHRRAPRPAR